MAQVSTYLFFDRNTEEVFSFYKTVFKTEFVMGISRFGDIPLSENQPPLSEEDQKLVMNVQLPILGGHLLMGSDSPEQLGMKLITGNNVHIALEPDSKADTDELFAALSAGGVVTMPLQDMFWGAYYGSCTDRFGIMWIFNFPILET